ncbi:MAG: energy transducer TonB [Azoarcus sp.]|jgi:protein TonB|nr:energy transducer TonB [Azoarcus sp.]
MNATCSAYARPDNPIGLRWFLLALFLHIGFFSSSRFWTPDRIETRAPESIQVSLIEMEAPPSEEPPAPLPPAPPIPQPPKPEPRPTPRPEPAPEAPTPLLEAPTEAPAAPAPPVPESAPASNAAANNASSASENSGAPSGASLVEAKFDAAYLHNPKPPYPGRARQLREEGTVRLRVHVLSDGKADQVEVQRGSGFTRLDESARMTVLRWRFVPGRRGNEAVAS